MRLIDADKFEPKFVHGRWDERYISETELKNAPTVDAVVQKHGRWIDETFEPHGLVFYPFRCDQCGEHNSIPSDYCPSCGADMRGEAK